MKDSTKRQELFGTNKYEKINYNSFCEVIATARDCLSNEYTKRYGGLFVEHLANLPEFISEAKEEADGALYEIIYHLNVAGDMLNEYLPLYIEKLESAIND